METNGHEWGKWGGAFFTLVPKLATLDRGNTGRLSRTISLQGQNALVPEIPFRRLWMVRKFSFLSKVKESGNSQQIKEKRAGDVVGLRLGTSAFPIWRLGTRTWVACLFFRNLGLVGCSL
jgi:hypothetical protein